MKIPVCKTEGIIIRRFNSGEFDKLLVVYTKEFGKILVKAKSLRKKAAKLKETLELFNHIHVMLARGKSMDTIAGAMIIESFPNIRSNLLSLAVVYYMFDLIDKLIAAPEKDERIWHLLSKALFFLEEKKRNSPTIKKLLNRFEYNLISYLGYRPASANEALQASRPEKAQRDYVDFIQGLAGEKIESFSFLQLVL